MTNHRKLYDLKRNREHLNEHNPTQDVRALLIALLILTRHTLKLKIDLILVNWSPQDVSGQLNLRILQATLTQAVDFHPRLIQVARRQQHLVF